MKRAMALAAVIVLAAMTGCGASDSSEKKSRTSTTTVTDAQSAAEESSGQEAATTTKAEESSQIEDTQTEQTTKTPDESETTTTTEAPPQEQKEDVTFEGNEIKFEHFAADFAFPDGWTLTKGSDPENVAEAESQQAGIAVNIQRASYDGQIKLDDYIESVEKIYNDLISAGDEGDPMAMKNLSFETSETKHGSLSGVKHLTSYSQRNLGNVYIYEFIYPDDDSTELLFFTFAFNDESGIGEVDRIME